VAPQRDTETDTATIVASQTRCVFIAGTADGVNKSHAVERSLKSLREAIDEWKTENGHDRSVSETAEKPMRHPLGEGQCSPSRSLTACNHAQGWRMCRVAV
jgi:hypothetical protein